MNDTNPTSSAHIDNVWIPLRDQDVPPDTMKVVEAVIEYVPELPASVGQVIEMTSNEKSNMNELVRIISSDPIMVSKILKIVNSSYYGLSRKMDNIQIAIVLLGLKEVKNIALKGLIGNAFANVRKVEGYDVTQLWEHSYLVSVCAETFADEDNQQLRGTLLTLGLLHDIGKFALYDVAMLLKEKGIKPQGLEGAPKNAYIMEKEELLFGVNHTIVGKLLAKKWNFSDRVAKVLECHHFPVFFGMSEIPADYLEEISAICIADQVVAKYKKEENILPEPHPSFFEVLNVSPPIDNLLDSQMEEKLAKAEKFVELLF